ncbi:MurR/RpiR family transcriptional regulator [Bifidobacterium callitrichos]|uniref:Transcriptional regulator n=1 Tax=Bifidobacterium callitrichos DSM 23973 TaxID=1437609 RepID=A0A087A5K6_9BIFI|nr:MurR/RpiR family transcriptional regulator [Bifidobacterium callitrichos]KFI54056.1 transcriptional regulator [Bifidobacterium callitrichos DSM 23973]
MFTFEQLTRCNRTELMICRFVSTHVESVAYMSVRELAAATYVSPSTIMRWCVKMGFEGFDSFKAAVHEAASARKSSPVPQADLSELSLFFSRADSPAFEAMLGEATSLLEHADPIVFVGEGSSGTIADYGARPFANLGLFAIGLTDAFYPTATFARQSMAVIAVSESGETPKLLELMEGFASRGATLLALTNATDSTLAAMCDWSFAAGLSSERVNGGYNATSQLPAVFVIESLSRRLVKLRNDRNQGDRNR